MEQEKIKYYPTFLQAAHLVILYIFIQTLVDFPLALYDYYNGTDLLYIPLKNMVVGVGSVLFILYYGYRKSKAKFIEVFPMKFFNPLILAFIFPFLLAAQVILTDVNILVEKEIPPPGWFWELFNGIFESDYGWFGTFIKVAIIAPVVEESIFRGVIMNGFLKNYPKFPAIFLSALLFALFHLNPWQFPATFVLGLLLGWLMARTNNIFACMFGHAVNNFLVLATITFWQVPHQNLVASMDKWVLLSVCGLAMAASITIIFFLSRRNIIKATPQN